MAYSIFFTQLTQVASGNGLLTGVEVLVKGERQSGNGGAYGPGVGLGEIPWTEMRMEFEENSEEEETAKSGSIRSRSTRGFLLLLLSTVLKPHLHGTSNPDSNPD